jgi:competence protein ComEA
MRWYRIKHHVKEFFHFNKAERNGIVVLLILLVAFIIVRLSLPYLLVKELKPADVSILRKQIEALERANDSVNQSKAYAATSPNHNKAHSSFKSASIPVVELNSVDSAGLVKLPRIGSFLAHRILKYRSILGGFYSKKQISEVYGISEEISQQIEPYLKVDTTRIQLIDVNSCDFKKINAHPYITFDQTKALCKLRSRHLIRSISQLEASEIFPSGELKKLRPYLRFN